MKYNVGDWALVAGTITPKRLTVYDLVSIEEYRSEYEPIPLTPEILVKAGFGVCFTSDPQQPNASKQYLLGLFPIHQPNENTYNFYFFTEDFDIKVECVHQLQNLYFALTGEELNIQL